MFKKKQSLSERFSLVGGKQGEESISQSNKDLIAKLRGRTEKWSSASNLHSDLLEKKTDDSKCVSVDSSKGKLNVTLKVNQNDRNGSSDYVLPKICEDRNLHGKLHREEGNSLEFTSEKGSQRKNRDNVPKLSVLERGYCDIAPQPTYESKKFRRHNDSSQWHEQKKYLPKRWPSNSHPNVKERNRNYSNGHFDKANREQSKYQESADFISTSQNGTLGKRKAGFNLPYCGFIESDAFQDEMDDVYRSNNQCHENGFNTRNQSHKCSPERLQTNKSLKMATNEMKSSFDSSPGSAAVYLPNSKSPVSCQQQEFFSKDKRRRSAGSPRTFQYKGFYSEAIDNDRSSQGSNNNGEKSEKDILVDSLFKHCQALVTNEQDKQALNQVRKILEIETGHEVSMEDQIKGSASEADTSSKGTIISDANAINPQTKNNFKKHHEIPARFSPSISSTSSPDNNKLNLLKFEGRTLLKGGVKPRHIPKATIEKPGLDPPSDPRLKEKYGKSSCYLALPKWHKDFVLEQKDKILKCINRSISSEIMNNNHSEENDRNVDAVDMDLDEEPKEATNDVDEEYNPYHFEPDPFIPSANEIKVDDDQNTMQSCSTAAEMEQSIMHFLKRVQSNEGIKVHSKEQDRMKDGKFDDKLIKLLKDTRTEIETGLDFCGDDSVSKVSGAKESEEKQNFHVSERKEMDDKKYSSTEARRERDRNVDSDTLRHRRRSPSLSKNGGERYRRRSCSRSSSISRSYPERHSRSVHDKRDRREITSHHSRYRSRSRSRSGTNSHHLHSEHRTNEEKTTKSTHKQLKTDTFMPQSYRRDDAYKRDLSPLYCNRQ